MEAILVPIYNVQLHYPNPTVNTAVTKDRRGKLFGTYIVKIWKTFVKFLSLVHQLELD